jgi:SMODS and SLOG-associating 2TM effector domain 1/Protein of unknown function (DUF4231)
MAQLLESLADRQGTWSETANVLKRRHERVRWTVFVLSIFGALAAAIATQQADPAREVFAIIGGVLIALGGLLSARFLTPAKAAGWTRARAASEALKRSSYLYATQSAPYDDPNTRDNLLRSEMDHVETDVDDLLGDRAPTTRGRTPLQALDKDAYLKRIEGQIKWYESRAIEHREQARRLRAIEFSLAIATTVITTAVGAVSKEWLQAKTGIDFDWLALSGVLTTVSGAILAHIEASRFDYIVVSYLAASRRLRGQYDAAPDAMLSPSPVFSTFVATCERVMAEENGSWVAKFSAPVTK